MTVSAVAALIGEIGVLLSVVLPMVVSIRRVANGQKCQLRSEMLRIYYHNREHTRIRQYEYENFTLLYEAYKALGGNSFIDRIRQEVNRWEIVT